MHSDNKARRKPYIDIRLLFVIAFAAVLLISDYTFPGPPSGEPVRVVVWAGTAVQPADFVDNIKGYDVAVTFDGGTPDTEIPGVSNIAIKLEDVYGNITMLYPQLCVYRAISHKTVEIGTDLSKLSALDFIEGSVQDPDLLRFTFSAGIENVSTESVGKYSVNVLLDDKASFRETTLDIVDVIPPSAMPVSLERWTDEELNPHDFVTDIADQTAVTVEFYEQPHNSAGSQIVKILLTDEGGNKTIILTQLILFRDTEPPVITGEFDKSVCIGEVILYRAGITVTDNRDEDIQLNVNSDAVNPNVAGIYPVIYSATDSAGNTTTVEGSLNVYNVPVDEVNKMIDEIYNEIIKPDMNARQKARAIFDYVRFKIVYGTNTIKDNVHYAAYRALKSGVGDCYSSYAVCELLLTRAGIDNIPIKRLPDYPTRHFWSLVNIGDGWHHFDTTQMTQTDRGFMLTDSGAERFTADIAHIVPGYYVYDKSLYPEVVK